MPIAGRAGFKRDGCSKNISRRLKTVDTPRNTTAVVTQSSTLHASVVCFVHAVTSHLRLSWILQVAALILNSGQL
jgi:hypothetical protein